MSEKRDADTDAGRQQPRQSGQQPEEFPQFEERQYRDTPTRGSERHLIFGLLPNPLPSHAITQSDPPRRGRARSSTLVGNSNPLEFPLTPEEQEVSNLAQAINRQNQSRRVGFQQPAERPLQHSVVEEREKESQLAPHERERLLQEALERGIARAALRQSGAWRGTHLYRNADGLYVQHPPIPESPSGLRPPRGSSIDRNKTPTQEDYNRRTGSFSPLFSDPDSDSGYTRSPSPSPIVSEASSSPTPLIQAVEAVPAQQSHPLGTPSQTANPQAAAVAETIIQHSPSAPTSGPRIFRVELPSLSSEAFRRLQFTFTKMNYQNYIDSPQGGQNSNPRQAPPSPSQGMHANGMNGGTGIPGAMVGFPTPAGHQSDLNYIMQMVEELAGQLAHNQGITAGIVDKMGKVRAKAKNMDLTNDELIAVAASELNLTSDNLEKENSELRKALDKALYDKKENWKLAVHGATILSDILDKMHKFKLNHEADTLAWHRNYRKQLADEREENLNLRNQINDMKAAACRANEHLRQMRRYLTDSDEMHELRVQNIALRQERRMWKRMALPLISDDDSEWSDDDDIIDPEQKKRDAAAAAEKERKEKEGGESDEAHGPSA